jgi:glyoxylase-like metal-dependent hydrolase (beta-lactamase superfamily II)
MTNWITVEKIDNNTFAISEYKHFEQTHAYLIIGNRRAALVDTGLGVVNICEIVKNLTNLPIFVIITHAHWDHIGGLKYFENYYIHKFDASWTNGNFPLPLSTVKRELTKFLCEFPKEFCLQNYEIFTGPPTKILTDGDEIDIGDRILKVVHTPGHSPGHICIFEANSGYLFSGDLIYSGTLDIFYESTDPEDFAKSVQKIADLPVKKLLPAHFSLDISVNLISEINNAFCDLRKQKLLHHGAGIFDFVNFKIHM